MIENILHETDENKKLQVVVINHLRKVWCESCGNQGHRYYDCPEKLLQINAAVYCNFCHKQSHPTSDCPLKHKKRMQTNGQQPFDDGRGGVTAGMDTLDDNPDEELYQLLQDVNKSKMEKQKLKAVTYGGEIDHAENGGEVLPMQDYENNVLDQNPEGTDFNYGQEDHKEK